MISLDDLRVHLRVPAYDYYEDAYIEGLEVAAVAAIENWTRRYFGAAVEVEEEHYDGDGGDVIWLNDTPVVGATITVEEYDGANWNAIDSADYSIDGFGLYHGTSYWGIGRRNVRVTYERGYEPGDEPAAIRQAVFLLVAHWYQNREPVNAGIVAASELPLSVTSLIAPYRKITV